MPDPHPSPADSRSFTEFSFPPRVVVHGHTPGQDLSNLIDQISRRGLNVPQTGFEMDVIITKQQGPCIGSRDTRFREPLREAVAALRKAGFGGVMFLDVTQRRAGEPVMRLLTKGLSVPSSLGGEVKVELHDDQLFFSCDPMLLFFNAPKNSEFYRNDPNWDPKKLVVLAQWTEIVRSLSGHSKVLQWEPLPVAERLNEVIELAKGYPIILYKTPWDTYNAKFDQSDCAVRELRALAEADLLSRVVPFGSLDNIQRLREVWDKTIR